MSGRTDIAKGRIKEAAGVLTDNAALRRKGRADQMVGQGKRIADKTINRIVRRVAPSSGPSRS